MIFSRLIYRSILTEFDPDTILAAVSVYQDNVQTRARASVELRMSGKCPDILNRWTRGDPGLRVVTTLYTADVKRALSCLCLS